MNKPVLYERLSRDIYSLGLILQIKVFLINIKLNLLNFYLSFLALIVVLFYLWKGLANFC